jgi:phosphoribosylformimino-5-aminoimidazole carboxamide ribotide isomerase
MEVIPVIDLMGGAVVRARLGRRDSYAPIETPLSPTSAPLDVVAGLLALHHFGAIYVADLDAILARGDHDNVVRALADAFPQVGFWVDAGVAGATRARSWLSRHPRNTLVLGSESLQSPVTLEQLATEERIILSLDFLGDSFLGPAVFLAAQHLWPARVIVMTLSRIGADAGPDLDRLSSIMQTTDARIYAAGGVRGPADLDALARCGAHGVLLASALHDGLLTAANLAAALK